MIKAHRDGSASCNAVLRNLRRFAGKTDAEIAQADVSLVDAQFAVALEYGFRGWCELKAHVTEMPDDSVAGQLSMPAPGKEPGNTYARAMSAVLSYLGTEVSYDEVMGISGVAFILQVDTSGPYIDGELDCAWWPNDPWGFYLGLPILSLATGWKFAMQRCGFDTLKDDPAGVYQRQFATRVEQSLAAGKPVLAEYDHCFIVTAVDEQSPPLIGYGTRGKSTRFEEVLRMSNYPCGLITLGQHRTPDNLQEVDLASLQHILTLFNEQAYGSEVSTRCSGRRAWAQWLGLLQEGVACDNNMLIHLRYNRRSAAAYLDAMSRRYDGTAATRLSAATDLYRQIVDEASKQDLPYGRVQKGEDEQAVCSEYAAMIETVSQLEEKAISELEAAAEAMADVR